MTDNYWYLSGMGELLSIAGSRSSITVTHRPVEANTTSTCGWPPVGADIFDLSTKTIAPEGRLLVIGFAAGRIPSIQVNRILLKNISIVGVLWGGWIQTHPAYPAEVQSALEKLYLEGKIKPVVARTYTLDQAPEVVDLVLSILPVAADGARPPRVDSVNERRRCGMAYVL